MGGINTTGKKKQCPQIYFHSVFRHSQFQTFTTSFTLLHVTQHNKLGGAGSNEVGICEYWYRLNILYLIITIVYLIYGTGYRRRVKKTTYSLLCAIVKITAPNQ